MHIRLIAAASHALSFAPVTDAHACISCQLVSYIPHSVAINKSHSHKSTGGSLSFALEAPCLVSLAFS